MQAGFVEIPQIMEESAHQFITLEIDGLAFYVHQAIGQIILI